MSDIKTINSDFFVIIELLECPCKYHLDLCPYMVTDVQIPGKIAT